VQKLVDDPSLNARLELANRLERVSLDADSLREDWSIAVAQRDEALADLAQCRTSIDSMDEQIDKLRAELALARKVLGEHQWCGGGHPEYPGCQSCEAAPYSLDDHHTADCEWRRAMGEP
jgi:hypothetical protein